MAYLFAETLKDFISELFNELGVVSFLSLVARFLEERTEVNFLASKSYYGFIARFIVSVLVFLAAEIRIAF